jgi:hypothetical protein
MKSVFLALTIVAAFTLTGCSPESLVGSNEQDLLIRLDGTSGHN